MDTTELSYLFDLDGTLVITDTIYARVWEIILKEYNLCIDEIFFNNFIKGKSDLNFLKFLLPNITPENIDKISIEKDKLFKNIIENEKPNILIDGVLEFFEKIKNNKIAIVTNCNKNSAEFILKYCNLDKYINLLISANDCTNNKPDPEPYIKAIELLNLDLNKTIIFEDSETGFISAKMSNVPNIILIVSDKTNPDLLNNENIKIKDFKNLSNNNLIKINSNNQDKYEFIIKNKLSYLPINNVKINPISLKTGYICDILCYDITFNNLKKDTIILKISNLNNELSKTATKLDMYNLETYFYEHLSNIISSFINVPKSFGTITDGEKKGIIMENLKNYSGEFNIDLSKNIRLLLKVINNIYKLHHTFFFNNENEITDLVKPLKTPNKITYYSELIKNRFDKFILKNTLFLTTEEKNILTNIYQNFDKIQNELSEYPLSLCHGDLKSPNIFYKGNKNPIFLDWQYLQLNKGVSDISFLMIESIPFEPNTCNLVLNYYFQLINECNIKISREEYLKDFKNSICNFPYFVCIWFNSEDSDKLLDKSFPLRFMKNLLNYYKYYLNPNLQI